MAMAMASAGGGAPDAVGGLAASSLPPPRPPYAAPPRAVVASGAYGYGGDFRGSLREVLERLLADGHADLVSAPSCVGARSPPPPPPPRAAASPPALVASHGHGGGDLRDSLRKVFEWLVANGYVESVASCVGSPPRQARRAAPPRTLVASCGHGGGDSLREVYDYEWLVANGYVDAATGVVARSSTPPPRRAAPLPSVVASDAHGGGDLRDPLFELFERLVDDGCVHLAPPAFGSPFQFCAINFGRFRASYLLNLNSQNSEALLLINQKDMAEAYYPQGQSASNPHHPRIQVLNVDGSVHEEADDLSDALALFITKPKLFAQPSLLLSDIGLKNGKAHVHAAIDLNSAIREFDHATKDKLVVPCTSAPLFCLATDKLFGGSQFSFLHHEHGTRTDRWITPQVLTCRQCENSAATIQHLIQWNSILEQTLKELYKHNNAAAQCTDISGHDTGTLKPEPVHDSVTDLKYVKSATEKSKKQTSEDNAPGPYPAPNSDTGTLRPELVHDSVTDLKDAKNTTQKPNKQTSEDNAPDPYPAPNFDTESAGGYQEEKLMEKFNKMLVDCVFFALPQVLIFFPRYEAPKASEEKLEQRLTLMAIVQQTESNDNEKAVVVSFFMLFVTAWILGLVLSLFGRGSRCTAAVSLLTLWTVGSTVAFIDYMLCKCLPEDGTTTWLFGGHFVAMLVAIGYIWFTYIGVPKFPSIRLPSFQGVFGLLRGWRPSRAHDAGAEEVFKRGLLQV